MSRRKKPNNNQPEGADSVGSQGSATSNGSSGSVPPTSASQQATNSNTAGSQGFSGSTNSQIANEALTNMINISGQVTFSNVMGMRVQVGTPPFTLSAHDYWRDEMYHVVPGIMTVEVVPCYGDFHDRTSAINVAAAAEYGVMRRAQTGSKNYDQASMMLTQLALADVFSALGWLTRAYGITTLYSADNRYVPYALLEANHLDAEDFLSNKDDLLFGINQLVYEVSTFAVPRSIPLFARRANQFANVYREYEGPRAQMYMYVPQSFLRYTSRVSDESPYGGLTYERVDASVDNWTVKQALKFVRELIEHLMWNDDITNINGDLAKAFGADLVCVSPISADYMVKPVVDITELETIKNLTDFSSIGNLVVRPIQHRKVDGKPTSTLEAEAYMETPNAFDLDTNDYHKFWALYMNRNMILSTCLDQPTTLDIVNRCRLAAFAEPKAGMKQHPITCGAELVTEVKMWSYDWRGVVGGPAPRVKSQELITGVSWDLDTSEELDNIRYYLSDLLDMYEMVSNFKYAPAVYRNWAVNGEMLTTTYQYDFDNFTVVPPSDLDRIFVALRAYIFNVPRLG
nr:capsid protein [Marmot picobirnavirus]